MIIMNMTGGDGRLGCNAVLAALTGGSGSLLGRGRYTQAQ